MQQLLKQRPCRRTLSSQKTWEEPELVSNSLRARAMVPKALKGRVGTCTQLQLSHWGEQKLLQACTPECGCTV